MTIKETIKAVQDLAAEVPKDVWDSSDDLNTLGYLLASCTPELSWAAAHHLAGQFHRLRERAILEAAA